LHKEVEDLAKEHRKDVISEAEALKNRLTAATSAKAFTDALLGFNRTEELVAMSREVRSRLMEFQKPPDPAPPAWKQPRLNPPLVDSDQDAVVKLFGTLTFEGEVVRSVLLKTFNARTQYDEKDCALCDIALDNDGNIIVVDRDNRKVKIFDVNGNLKMSTAENAFKTPNRVAFLRQSKTILVKDEKYIRILSMDGNIIGAFGDRELKQPVGLAQAENGDVLVTEWTGSSVVVFSEKGTRLRSFPTACEAAGYITGAPNGNILVTDWKQHVVKIFDSAGNFIRQYGSQQGSGPGQLDHPYGVCCDRFNHIVISDTWNNRIQLLSAEGKFINTLMSKDDGIEWPQAVVVDQQGRLIIVEQHGLIKIYQYIA
jgi:sugar lactone lactonase YvrE